MTSPTNLPTAARSLSSLPAPTILPSLLQLDFGELGAVVSRLEGAGARGFHLDVMDGVFVPNFTYGMPIVEACRARTVLPLDVHLMMVHPERYVEAFAKAGADCITVHLEAVADPAVLLKQIRSLGVAAGLAYNPPTPVERVLPFLELCDLVLTMSVMPGFGGQSFDAIALDKLRVLKQAGRAGLRLEVDGGVNEQTIANCTAAGADLLVVGSALLKHPDFAPPLQTLTRLATGGSAK